jgi:RHS repeat-associated protein
MARLKKAALALLLLSFGFGLILPAAAQAAPSITSLSINSGMVGAQVIVTGTGFGSPQGSSTIKFNGTTATASNWTATSITVTVPAGATTGNVVVNVGGTNSNGKAFTVTKIPTGWTDGDVGSVGLAGTATFANGAFSVSGAGNQVASTADGMHFAYQSLAGDGTIIARLSGFSGTSANSQAGIMIRETLTAGATNFFAAYQNSSDYISDRLSTGAVTTSFSGSSVTLPIWLKLVRTGSTFSGYASTDGFNWTQIRTSQTITMASNVYIGLGVSSGSTSALATATFDNVSINSSASAAPTISSLSATTGSIGNHVVITGSGFGALQSSSIVYLNGATVPVTSWGSTSITITIPTGAVSGPLVVSVAPSMNDSNAVEFEVTTQPLPSPWLNQDVGAVGPQGSATFANGSFTLNGAGLGVFNMADSFHFVYQTLSGDGSIVARVSNIQGTTYQAGVMIRETLGASSTNAFVYFQPSTAQMNWRPSTGASTSYQTASFVAPAYPYWVKLARSGNTFISYVSLDAQYWVQVATETITMSDSAYIGLAVSSESISSLATVKFDNVSVDSTTSPAPTISSLSATTGAIGSQVVIYGTGFGSTQGSSVVTLNGTAVTVNQWSATSITVTIPSGATSGLMGVSVAPSMNNSNTVFFTVTTQPLPFTWLDTDIGQVGTAGSATFSNGTFTVNGAGQGIASNLDGFHYVYQQVSGDATIIARITNLQNPYFTPQAGVMIRESVHPDATNAFVYFDPNTASFHERSATGSSTTAQSTSFANPAYPYWVKLTRTGNNFSGYISSDGYNWTQIGTSQTIVMATNALIGLAVSNWSTGVVLTASFDGVSVSTDLITPPSITSVSATTGSVGSQLNIYGQNFGNSQGISAVLLNDNPVTIRSWSSTQIGITIPTGASSGYLEVSLAPSLNSSNPVNFTVTTQPLPVGWLDGDVGSTTTAGSATYSSGTFTINALGTGVTGTADGFHFVYQPLSGDGVVVARVASITNQGGSPQVGLMFRETLSPSSVNVFTYFIPSTAYFRYRYPTGGSTTSQSSSFVDPNSYYWLKVARTGNSFNVYVSSDGVTWTQVATTTTVTIAQTVYVGMGASNWGGGGLLTATFDNVTVTPGTMPTISGIAPASGGIGTSVTVTGSNFGSPQGTSKLYFNGVQATSITSWATNQIVAVAPAGATSGPVTVVVNSIQSNTNFSFALYNPQISSLSPPAGQVGSVININGSGFGQTEIAGNQVRFNGTPGSVSFWSDIAISVYVPPAATSGPVSVVVGGVTSNTAQFSVESLSVTSVSPNTGVAGSIVTIQGTGFGGQQSNSTVDFYGTPAAIQSWTDTQIHAIVPPGTASGSVNVTVAGTIAYGPQFTITRNVQITDSKSNNSTYTSAMIGGLWVPVTVQGSGCSTCTERGNISYTYDSAGHPLTRVDENGNTTSYTYDSYGNVLTVNAPISSGVYATTTYTYNALGEVQTVTDPLRFVTTNAYDANGNLLSVTTPAPGNGPAASVTRFAYNSLGEMTSITDPLNNTTTITYTTAGLINTITDAQSNVTTYGYDSQGNRTSVKDALNNQTNFTYDAMNRLTKITYPDTTTTQFGYDHRGRRTTVTDQNSKMTTYAYDDADRLLTVTDAANNVTTYGYDTESNLTSIQDANHNTTNFSYDAFGRVTQTNFPSTKIETYGYDNLGNLTSKTDRKNQLITYTYDQLNRLTKKTYPDTTTVNYTYDYNSRLTQVVDPTGTYTFTFDNMGRLTGTTTQYTFLTGRSFTDSYGYDVASNRTSFTDPENGSTAYLYDTLNRLQTLTPPTAYGTGSFGFGYDALSRRTSLTRPNSVGTSYTYDTLSRLLGVTHAKSGTTLDGASYTVDNAGNRLTRTPLPSGTASTFGYDNIYELLSVTQGGTTKESYTYDPVGNRLTALGGAAWSYATSNELNSRPGISYTYDYNGNTQTTVNGSSTTTYNWDFENRLTSVVLPGSGGTVSFKYDPFGRRIYKSSSLGTSVYAYDGDNLVEETNASGGVVARYSQGLNIDEPLAILRSSTTSYYQADGLDSVSSLSNAAGALAQTYTFDSFGNQTASSGSLTNSFRYAGREFDTETGLYYMRARYFDPATGRFLSEDPTGFDGDAVDFYGYAGENPTNSIDPFGEQQGAGTTTAPAPPTTNPPSAPPVKAPPRPILDPPLPTPQPGPGWWPGLGAILGRGVIFGLGELLLAPPTARDEDLLPKPHDKTPPCENKNGPDCKKADQFHLDGAGISDPHEFKKEHLGRKGPISRYDICACNDGSIVIKPRGQCGSPGPGIDTGRTWK